MANAHSFAQPLPGVDPPRDPKERRASARVPVQTDVTVYDDRGRVISGISTDVSAAGIFVAAYAIVPATSRVTLRFRLPTGHVIATGIVRWTHDGCPGRIPGMGIELTEMSTEDRDTLQRFCEQSPRWLSYREIDVRRR
jgi:uncharacterized protein (TIGR02266 family)